MTTQFLTQDVQRDEGYAEELPDGSCKAYPDPLSGAEPWTIGWGTTGPDITQGTIWTRAQAEAALADKLNAAEADLDQHIPWWRSLSDARQDVFPNMAYNLGWPRLSGFHQFLAAAKAGNYETAASEMLDSAWAKQVHGRATRLAEQMRTGVRA